MSSSLTYGKKERRAREFITSYTGGREVFQTLWSCDRGWIRYKEGCSYSDTGLRELSKRKEKLLANFLMFEKLYSTNLVLLNSSKL